MIATIRNILKRVVLLLCLGTIFVFAGLFFAGCGESASEKLTLTASQSSVTLYRGETKEIQFTIGNFVDGVDNSLSYSLYDSTAATTTSAHITLKEVSRNDNVIVVQITAISGGQTILVATTNEGSKSCSVQIDVLQYSNSVALDESKMLYVTPNSSFVPTDEMFVFEDNSTEKNLTFHYAMTIDQIGELNLFSQIKYEQGQLNFYFANGEKNANITPISVSKDGQGITAYARYSFFEYIDGARQERTIVVPFVFYVLKGLEDDAIEIDGIEKDQLTLVVNGKDEQSYKKTISVTIPYSPINSNAESTLSNSFIKFDYTKPDIFSAIVSGETYNKEDNKLTIDFEITSSTTVSQQTELNFDLYYMVGEQSFKNEESYVSKQRTIQINLKVAPISMLVNNVVDSSIENNYVVYNNYGADFGWHELKINVYNPQSDYEGVRVYFNDENIQLRQGNNYYNNGDIILKSNLSEPVKMRGLSTANVSSDNNQIIFSVESDYIDESGAIEYYLNYKVKRGPYSLSFTNPLFDYQATNLSSGVFLSLADTTKIFEGLVADAEFETATVLFLDGDAGAVNVGYLGNGDLGEGKFSVQLSVTPRRIGQATYLIMLDNGISKQITFKVINTFDDVMIEYDSLTSDGVLSAQQLTCTDLMINATKMADAGMQIILQNMSNESITFNKTANIKILNTNGYEVFENVQFVSTNPEMSKITSSSDYDFTIMANSYGYADIVFSVYGTAVEDFIQTVICRFVLVKLISFIPTNSFSMTNSSSNDSPVVELFIGSNVANKDLQQVSFSAQVSPELAYGFYNPKTQQYENNFFSDEFIYWTLDGASAFAYNEKVKTWVYKDQLLYGETYRIGSYDSYFGTFDTVTKTFIVNENYETPFTFSLFASLRQYGSTRYYAATIKGLPYESVTSIYTNLSVDKKINFTPTTPPYEFGVYLNPTDVTETGIVAIYTSSSSDEESVPLLVQDEIQMDETYKGSGIWIVTLKLNDEVITSNFKSSGELKIVPESWMSNGAVLPAYENLILRFDVSYSDGTENNPFVLSTAEDILNIGSNEKSMSAYYVISSTIDVSSISDQLPIGKGKMEDENLTFTGSIEGKNNAKIIGINLTSYITNSSTEHYSGLFAKLGSGAFIQNITLEGRFAVTANTSNELNIGLLAGMALTGVTGVTIENVSARIYASSINISSSANIGGLIGNNQGNIQNPNILFEDFIDITVQNPEAKEIVAGGIVGVNSGEITGGDRANLYGYSAYSSYALIRVLQDNPNKEENFVSSDLLGYAGAVAGKSTAGSISKMLVGGEVWAEYSGGVVGDLCGGYLFDITTRTFIRGANIGLIIANFYQDAVVGYDDSQNNFPISVEAVDDGKHENEYASMAILYTDTDNEPFIKGEIEITADYSDTNFNKIFLGSSLTDEVGVSNGYLNDDSAVSYSSRKKVGEFENNVEEFEESVIIVNNLPLNEYYGDYLVIDDSDSTAIKIKARASFTNKSVQFSVQPNASGGFAQLHSTVCPAYSNTESECNCEKQVYFAYYFKAEGYYRDGSYLTSDLTEAQNQLDVLNKVKPGDLLYPFEISGNDVHLRTSSPYVNISTDGEVYIKGTGLAEIEIFSLLNENQKQTIYLYIINYFDYKAYAVGELSGIFKVGKMILGQNSNINVYSHSGAYVEIAPSYTLTNDNNNLSFGLADENLNISSSGLVSFKNYNIQLAKSNSFDINITNSDESNTLEYGYADSNSSGVYFSKKPNVILTKDSKDVIKLEANIGVKLNELNYKLKVTDLNNVTLNYFEGAKAILSLYDSYPINSSNSISEQVSIDSDDENDTLVIEILDENNSIVAKLNTADKNHNVEELFKIKALKSVTSNNAIIYNVEIGVDRTSKAFSNRFVNNIYKEYTVIYYANSNGYEIKKEVPLTLTREAVDVIVATNYPKINNLEQESDKIIPGQAGLMSVSISPVDADFEAIYIKNNPMNYLDGSAQASFQAGLLKLENNGSIMFNPIDYSLTSDGIKITRTTLEKLQPVFSGQIYIRYVFSNSYVIDGAQVAIDVVVEQKPANYQQTFGFTILKDNSVSIQIAGYPGKEQVARGVEYKLSVTAGGYDVSSIKVLSSDPLLGKIEQRQDGYYLIISNSEITDYNPSGGKNLKITVSASRQDEFGVTYTVDEELNLTVLEYVINFFPVSGQNYDLLAGMSDGVITSAVGEKTDFSFAFTDLIEYNPNNQSVISNVNMFLESLKNEGSWYFYTDLNVNTETGVSIYDTPLQESKSTKTHFNSGSSIKTKYLSLNGFSFTTFVAHNPVNRNYFFKYSGAFCVQNGRYVFCENDGRYDNNYGYRSIDLEININSFLRGSEESPNPITSYQDFLNMTAGGHYILLNDIEVTSEEFTPLNTAIASFDGNNYNFIFSDELYQLGSGTAQGLFGTVSANTFIKNVRVVIGDESVSSSGVTFNSSSSNSASIGIVAGINNGTISNAQVYMADGAKAYITFDSDPTATGYYFGGIVGQNAGYLTNCLSKIDVETKITMGGLVGQNSKIIASSAFKEGNLVSVSQYPTVFNLGGLVAENTESGIILTSFTSGFVNSSKPYSDNEELSKISASVSAGAFVYDNKGEISDCYSNIPIESTGNSAGFALYNSGSIIRAFSTSKILRGNSATDFHFSNRNSNGYFEDCYYIKGEINNSLFENQVDGVQGLTYISGGTNDFGIDKLPVYFSNYGYSTSPTYNTVWFYSAEGSTQSSTFGGQTFCGGRLELVSANITARGQREQVGTTTDANGTVTYYYQTSSSSPADGTAYNPYIIHSAETMEKYFANPNNIASSYYRFASDISYSELGSAGYSDLYKLTVTGSIEGNGMTVRDIRIFSNDNISSAGLFGQLSGYTTATSTDTSKGYASINNITIIPQIVTFPNANAVGTLAGTVRNAYVYNVNIYGANLGENQDESEEQEVVTVSGKNIVGGAIGMTAGDFDIKNINAYVGAFSSYVPSEDTQNSFTEQDLTQNSFAGGIIGYSSGRGIINRINVSRGSINIFADKAGFVFGGIASQVSASNISVSVNANMHIKSHRYAGLVVGELKGKISNIRVNGFNGTGEDLFQIQPYIPDAVGGIAGAVSGSSTSISQVYMGQNFKIGNNSIASVSVNTVLYVGGLVGIVLEGELAVSQAIVDANITARNILGGAIGEVSATATLVNINELAVKDKILKVEGQVRLPTVGGIIGDLENSDNQQVASVSINNSYVRANIELDTFVYSQDCEVSVGSIIGRGGGADGVKLDTIYSTTLYKLNIEDKSASVSNSGQVVRQQTTNTSSGTLNYTEAFALSSSPTEALEKFIYRNNYESVSQNNITNVFNSSILSTVDSASPIADTFDYLTAGFTTITTRIQENRITLYQNEYGIDVFKANGGSETSSSEDMTYYDKMNLTVYFNLFKTFKSQELTKAKDIATILGVTVDGYGDDNYKIEVDSLEENALYMYVGYEDYEDSGNEDTYDKDSRKIRKLNFVKVDESVWETFIDDYSILAFESELLR